MKQEGAPEGLRIPLVDDDEFVRDAVVMFLEDSGCGEDDLVVAIVEHLIATGQVRLANR